MVNKDRESEKKIMALEMWPCLSNCPHGDNIEPINFLISNLITVTDSMKNSIIPLTFRGRVLSHISQLVNSGIIKMVIITDMRNTSVITEFTLC